MEVTPSARDEFPGPFVLGSQVFIKGGGRHGLVIVVDDSELPYKVTFDDGCQPEHDWFAPESLCASLEEAKAQPILSEAERAECRLRATEDAGRAFVQAQLAEHEAVHAQTTRHLHDATIQLSVLDKQASRESKRAEALEEELASLRSLLQKREHQCSSAEERCSKLAKEMQALCDRHVADLQSLHAEIEEKDEVIRKLARGAEARSAAMAEESTVLREQLETASKCARLATAQLRELRRGKLVKEAVAAAGGVGAFEGKFALEVEDLEIGLQKSVTLSDVGLGSIAACTALDRRLSWLTSVVARRADVRFAVCGAWLFCHVFYMTAVFGFGRVA